MSIKRIISITLVLLLSSCTTFYKPAHSNCYNRDKEAHTSIVDTHVHFRPFGGSAIAFSELISYFEKTGVKFVNVYGIGQILPIDSDCTYYLDCLGTPALPSIKNDFINAHNYLEHKPKNTHLTLSMTFPDLTQPEDIVNKIQLYDKEYPNLFKWMGEVNLNKQALMNNGHKAATINNINDWAEFMSILEKRQIPINIHSDLGNNQNPTEFLFLMEHVLSTYPNNKIVWAHMGLSKELTTMDAQSHIETMKNMLNKHSNLMLDVAWRILEDNYFSIEKNRPLYVDFLNQYSTRILPGTDFVASSKKNFKTYKKELIVNSRINQYLNNDAFRNIALGENYFQLMQLDHQAPYVCGTPR